MPAQDNAETHARAVLGVAPTASMADITAAYRALVRALHPDHADHRSAHQQQRFTDVLTAYRTLREKSGAQAPSEEPNTIRVKATDEPAAFFAGRRPDLTIGPVRRHLGTSRTRPPDPRHV